MLSSSSMRDTMKSYCVKLAKFVVICLGIAAGFRKHEFTRRHVVSFRNHVPPFVFREPD